jgi:hypothetical protein
MNDWLVDANVMVMCGKIRESPKREDIMAAHTTELRDFHDFLSRKLSNGGADLSPEEALDEWRQLHVEPETNPEEVAAIQEALDDLAGGERPVAFDDFDNKFRKRHQLPAKP